MDFAIVNDGVGNPRMSWDKETTVRTNIFYSGNIEVGTFFQNPTFGIKLSDIKKITPRTMNLIKQRIENAYSWILDIGRAKELNILVEPDNQNINRINYKVDITQADGIPVSVSGFITVGGASSGFTL